MSQALVDLSPPKQRNPETIFRGDAIKINAGEIMNNSRHNGSFSVGDSPVKGIHRRNLTELPQTTKSG